jgi:hypothetical protein
MTTKLLVSLLLLLSAFCLWSCGSSGAVLNAAEAGFKRDITAAGQVINFKEVKTVEKQADGKAILFYFESTVRWLTFDEAVNDKAHPQDPETYVNTIHYVHENLLTGPPKLGTQQVIQGAAILVKTDLGWEYKGLTRGQ